MDYRFINTEYLESVAGGDISIMSDLVELFRQQADEIYNEMKDLHSAGEWVQLGMLAHKAKSSVAIMGMNDLAVMLKTFELQAKDGREKENYGGYINRYREETSLAIAELDDFIRNK